MVRDSESLDMTSEFLKHILNYAKLHPDDPLSSYKQAEKEKARKEKSKKWKLIDTALRNYESRPARQDDLN